MWRGATLDGLVEKNVGTPAYASGKLTANCGVPEKLARQRAFCHGADLGVVRVPGVTRMWRSARAENLLL